MSYPIWVHLFRVLVVFGFFLTSTAFLIWGERRIVARMQSRVGPNRVGPFGTMQSVVDGVKMFFKEDVTPGMVSKFVFTLAPAISVVVALLSFAIVPIGGEVNLWGETFNLQIADLNIGILWFLAMGSINVYGIVLAGWASNSPYPLLGAVRSSAQMISYEIAQGLAVAAVFIYAGTLKVSEIVAIQAGESILAAGVPNWFVVPLFPSFIIFFVGMVAETQRPPFDLPEAEGELVGGFNTEYSGARFMLFFLAEFMNVIIVSAVAVTMFFGGPSGPIFFETVGGLYVGWVFPFIWFLLKVMGFLFVFILLRGALPRMRYDKLMNIGWKVLIPAGLVWVMVTATFVVLFDQADDARLYVVGGGLTLAALLYVFAPYLAGEDEDEDLPPRSTRSAPELEEVG